MDNNKQRERLVELLLEVIAMLRMRSGVSECADYLLANGVIAPPVNVGQTIEDVAPVVHGEWIVTTKHKWKMNKMGEIDTFAWDHEFHNGSRCVICGYNPCIHCNPDWMEDDECDEHFICSVCGLHVEEKHPYCHCGAKMDGGDHE